MNLNQKDPNPFRKINYYLPAYIDHPNLIGYYFEIAFEQARWAYHQGEVPVGAVWTNGTGVSIVAANQIRRQNDATAHAEILAISLACQAMGNERLGGCLFTTLEPCTMCYGAAILARIDYLFYAAPDAKLGCCTALAHLQSQKYYNHKMTIFADCAVDRSSQLLKNFFRDRR